MYIVCKWRPFVGFAAIHIVMVQVAYVEEQSSAYMYMRLNGMIWWRGLFTRLPYTVKPVLRDHPREDQNVVS